MLFVLWFFSVADLQGLAADMSASENGIVEQDVPWVLQYWTSKDNCGPSALQYVHNLYQHIAQQYHLMPVLYKT